MLNSPNSSYFILAHFLDNEVHYYSGFDSGQAIQVRLERESKKKKLAHPVFRIIPQEIGLADGGPVKELGRANATVEKSYQKQVNQR